MSESGYIHGRAASETERLEAQAAFLGPALLEGVKVPTGKRRVLDLGCGVGAMTRLLVARGADGVIGVDRAVTQVRAASDLTRPGAAHFLVGAGERLPFEGDTFELVYTSWLLEHVLDVGVLLAEIRRVLRQGGELWAAEVENSSLLVWPRSEALEKAWDALNRTQLQFNGDPFIGRKMYSHLKRVGFGEVDVFPHTFHGHAGRPEMFAGVLREFVEILGSARRGVVEEAGLCDGATYDAAMRELAGLTDVEGGTFTYTFMRCRAVK